MILSLLLTPPTCSVPHPPHVSLYIYFCIFMQIRIVGASWKLLVIRSRSRRVPILKFLYEISLLPLLIKTNLLDSCKTSIQWHATANDQIAEFTVFDSFIARKEIAHPFLFYWSFDFISNLIYLFYRIYIWLIMFKKKHCRAIH
jgi:hypothetical protein